MPIAEKSARFLQNRLERRGVPNLEIRVDHNLRFSGRDEVIPVRVAPSAGQPNLAFDLVVSAVATDFVEIERVRRQKERVFESVDRFVDASRGRFGNVAETPSAAPFRRPNSASKRREPKDADDRFAVFLDSNQVRVKRNAGNERLRSVDRVDDPTIPARSFLVVELFAENRVVRERLRDAPPNQLFRAAVGQRYRRTVAFTLDAQIVPIKITQR